MLWTWQHADLSAHDAYGGDVARALGAIEARTIVMPCRTDLYFPPEDSAIEVAAMKSAELRVIDSDWGHIAGGPGRNPADTAFVEQAMRELLGPGTLSDERELRAPLLVGHPVEGAIPLAELVGNVDVLVVVAERRLRDGVFVEGLDRVQERPAAGRGCPRPSGCRACRGRR